MLLELLGDLLELGVGLGHVLGQGGDRGRGPDARDYVLALGVDEVLAEEDLLAGVGVAGEGTPVPESLPMLPKTIVTTLTAVPRSCAIFWLLR